MSLEASNKTPEVNESTGKFREELDDLEKSVTSTGKKDSRKEDEKKMEEKWETVETSKVTNAAISYIKSKAKINISRFEINLLGEKTEGKVRNIFNNYLNKYPLLKKNSDGKMKFEIGNKTEFSKTVSKLRETMIDGIPRLAKKAFQATDIYKDANKILSNINTSLSNLSADDYESIIFGHIGGVVKKVVGTHGGKMTLEDYYNDINKSYPNKNDEQVKKDLASSGWAKKNINETNWYS